MKTVELIPAVPLDKPSGIGRYARELYNHLNQKIDIEIKSQKNLPLSNRLTILRNFPIGINGHIPGNIVHFTQITGCAQMLWRPVHPAVVTVHDLGYLVCREDALLCNFFNRNLLQLHINGLKKIDLFSVNSDYTKQGLVEKLGIREEKIHFIQLGVDVHHFHPIQNARDLLSTRHRFEFTNDHFYIIYVGSELPRKNFGLLLKAISILIRQGYPVKLLKIGSAGGHQWRAKTLEHIEILGINNAVTIIDSVIEAELPIFYSASDLAITPTLLEGGFAWLAMEAMACRTAVIATDMAQIPEKAKPGVITIPSRNLDALVSSTIKCISDSQFREDIACLGYSIIKDYRYSWEATIENLLTLYQIAGVLQ